MSGIADNWMHKPLISISFDKTALYCLWRELCGGDPLLTTIDCTATESTAGRPDGMIKENVARWIETENPASILENREEARVFIRPDRSLPSAPIVLACVPDRVFNNSLSTKLDLSRRL